MAEFNGGDPGDGSGVLYVVAAPIGNAGDVSERARAVLSSVGVIAAEDTRIANSLLKSLGIAAKTVSYHKFNENYRADFILDTLGRGIDVAIISDAGTPCVSDPGAIVVRAAAGRGFRVTPVCGASAVTAALSVSGFDTDRFAFYGFLPKKADDIIKAINAARSAGGATGGTTGSAAAPGLKRDRAVAVFFESPKRILKTLALLAEIAPDSDVCLCNDLTKTYERIYRGAPSEVYAELAANPSAEKGEYTLVIMLPIPPEDKKGEIRPAPESAIVEHMTKCGCAAKEAVGALSAGGGYSRRELYEASLNLKRLFGDAPAPDEDSSEK